MRNNRMILCFFFLSLISITKGQEKNCHSVFQRANNKSCSLTVAGRIHDTLITYLSPGCTYWTFPPLPEGVWKVYGWDSTIVREIVGMQGGVREGPASSYFENGSLSEVCVYKKNVLSGGYKSFYANGKLRMDGVMTVSGQGNYGLFTGSLYRYWDNGQMANKEFIENDSWLPVREQFWTPDGEITDKLTFHDLWDCKK